MTRIDDDDDVLHSMDISNHSVPSVICKVGLSRKSRVGHAGWLHSLSVNLLDARIFCTAGFFKLGYCNRWEYQRSLLDVLLGVPKDLGRCTVGSTKGSW